MKKRILIISVISILLSLLIFALNKNWIIIGYQRNFSSVDQKDSLCKKNIKVYFYKTDKFNNENIELLWNNQDIEFNIEQIGKAWLTLLDEEKIINKKISLQSTVLIENNLYISFDSSIFDPELCVYDKLMLIESLFKSLSALNINLKIYFLKHNQPINDYHLDFSNPWSKELLIT